MFQELTMIYIPAKEKIQLDLAKQIVNMKEQLDKTQDTIINSDRTFRKLGFSFIGRYNANEYARNRGYDLLLMMDGDTVAAFTEFSDCVGMFVHTVGISNIYTDNAYRGRGCATQMIEEVCRRGKERKMRNVFIGYLTGNYNAVKLYRNLGFTTDRITDIYVADYSTAKSHCQEYDVSLVKNGDTKREVLEEFNNFYGSGHARAEAEHVPDDITRLMKVLNCYEVLHDNDSFHIIAKGSIVLHIAEMDKLDTSAVYTVCRSLMELWHKQAIGIVAEDDKMFDVLNLCGFRPYTQILMRQL